MARQMRVEYPGAIYHVTSRGNEKKAIFYEDYDRNCFLDILADVVKRYLWICHGYCLMPNHYHLIIETREGNLSRGMRQLNGVYSQKFNATYSRVGHLVQGRYKAILIDRENYLLELCRYIVLNPVRAKIVTKPEDYFWSSYRITAALQKCPDFLTIDWILKQFGEQSEYAQQNYIKFVYDGIDAISPWKDLRGQIILGKNSFIQTIDALIKQNADTLDIPKKQRYVSRESPIKLVTLNSKIAASQSRNKIIHMLHYENGIAVNQIAKIFSLHPSTISKIINHTHK